MMRATGSRSDPRGKVKATLPRGRRGSALIVRNMIPGSIGPTILRTAALRIKLKPVKEKGKPMPWKKS